MKWLIALWCLLLSGIVSATEITLDLSLGSKHYETRGYDKNDDTKYRKRKRKR